MLPLTALNPVYDSSFLLGNVEDCALLDYDAYWSCGCFSYDETIAHTGWKDEAQRVLPFGNQYGVRWSPFNGSSDDGSSCSCGCGCSSQTYSFSAPGFTVTISAPSISSSGVSVFVNGSYNGFPGSSCGSASNNNTGCGCGAPETGLAHVSLTHLVFALEAYRRDNGDYPDGLDALRERYIAEIPIDPFSGKAFRYVKEGENYLLYSVGSNGVDDEGRNHNDEPKGDDIRRRYGNAAAD